MLSLHDNPCVPRGWGQRFSERNCSKEERGDTFLGRKPELRTRSSSGLWRLTQAVHLSNIFSINFVFGGGEDCFGFFFETKSRCVALVGLELEL